ncbi:MAG TPA: hypothetical protein VN222_08160 [Novosphingobium sp.]|nr:hypothetical protein [Novosphingobium sp.]
MTAQKTDKPIADQPKRGFAMQARARMPGLAGAFSLGALALALGVAGHSAPLSARANKAASKVVANSPAPLATSIAAAEQAVAHSPRDSVLRAALGRAYLREGRYESAVAALGDAVSLGEGGGRTLLAYALAQVATGQTQAAVATLDGGAKAIPAVDLGLALALAGEAGRGAAVLADALASGDSSDKLRANLAYAYALDGRWAASRAQLTPIMSADQVDARITDWAQLARPDATRERVAQMLGAPTRSDPGMPAELALNAPAHAAAPAAAPVVAHAAPLAVQPAAAPASSELPALAAPEAPAPASRPMTAPVFAQVQPEGLAPPERHAAPKAERAPRRAAATLAAAPLPVTRVRVALGNSRAMQLGAFSSQGNAERARAGFLKRDPELRGREVAITRAMVNGRIFWRVGVTGIETAQVEGKCSSIRKRGSVCFAYTPGHLPGEVAQALAQR